MSTDSSKNGFTMVELLIALAIMVTLIAVAVPSFDSVLVSSRLRSLANDLIADTHLARSEALKRRAPVVLCPSTDGLTCGGAWTDGWIVACRSADGSTCATAGANTIVFQRQNPVETGYVVNVSSGAGGMTFTPTGLGATTSTVTLCRATPKVSNHKRQITVSATGRVSQQTINSTTCP